jgi:hypothetical protein
MEEISLPLKQLRRRFVSDYNLPIQLIHSPYFEERIELLEKEYSAKSNYNKLLNLIKEDFENNIVKFLEEYHSVRDKIINTVINSQPFKDFNSNNDIIKKFKPICDTRNLYTREQNGCLFISYDMKKANFQALKYADPKIVLDADTYEDFIGKFTDLDYVKNSKYTRQVIFGKMNPSRTISLERWLTNEFAKYLVEKLPSNFLPFSINADEIIFKFIGSEEEFKNYDAEQHVPITYNGIEFTLNKFKLHERVFKLATSSSQLVVYEKEDYINGHKRLLKAVPAHYFTQVYKLLNGMEIKPSDLKFYYEHEICSFDNPLTLIK